MWPINWAEYRAAAKARRRNLYVWLLDGGMPQSTINLAMVPYDKNYVVVFPSGRLVPIGAGS